MKRYFIPFPAIFFSISILAQSKVDILHYKYEIELNDNNDTIHGKSEIKFSVPTVFKSIDFDLSGKPETGKGMQIMRITYPDAWPVDASYDGKNFQHKNDKITINTERISLKKDTSSIIIEYKGIPSDGLIISKNKFGNRTFFADNWPNRAHHWIPCVDDPADKATVEFIVTAPDHYQVISNGVMIEETNLPDHRKITHWKENTPLPTKVMVIGAADFAVNNIGEVNCTPVSTWVFPENKAEGFYDYAPAKDILAWYINYIGPYAYKKLANVQSKTIYGGMENASAIFYHENSVTGNRDEVSLLAHEIAHQWFGNHVTEKSFAHIWLSEGFATYLTHLYFEATKGTNYFINGLQNDREQVIAFTKSASRPVVDSTDNLKSLINTNSYQKGSWVLHMLRKEAGDSLFHAIIQQFYKEYGGKNADTDDFKRVSEDISGKNLSQFFKQWLYAEENPRLKISWKYKVADNTIRLTVKQLQQSTFIFPLEIFVQFTNGVSSLQRITINQKVETFALPAAERPLNIIADPNACLLFEGNITEEK